MESNGVTYNLVRLSINEELVEEINSVNKTSFTLSDLQKAADKCLAHEWLTHFCLGRDRYAHLQITPKGIDAARLQQKAEQLKASRSLLKKISDYIEDHKGLFLVFGFILGIATLALKILADN